MTIHFVKNWDSQEKEKKIWVVTVTDDNDKNIFQTIFKRPNRTRILFMFYFGPNEIILCFYLLKLDSSWTDTIRAKRNIFRDYYTSNVLNRIRTKSSCFQSLKEKMVNLQLFRARRFSFRMYVFMVDTDYLNMNTANTKLSKCTEENIQKEAKMNGTKNVIQQCS